MLGYLNMVPSAPGGLLSLICLRKLSNLTSTSRYLNRNNTRERGEKMDRHYLGQEETKEVRKGRKLEKGTCRGILAIGVA